MEKNSKKDITPEMLTDMYISLTPEQEKLFWKMLTEEMRRFYGKKQNSDNAD